MNYFLAKKKKQNPPQKNQEGFNNVGMKFSVNDLIFFFLLFRQ